MYITILNWKKKYNQLLQRWYNSFDYIEDMLYDEDINLSMKEIKLLIKILLIMDKKEMKQRIKSHFDCLNDNLLSYIGSYVCKKNEVIIPIIEKELKKLEKEDNNA